MGERESLLTRIRAGIGKPVYRYGTGLECRLYGFKSERVEAAGVEFCLLRAGQQPGRQVLLMLHGFSADRVVWPRFARHFLRDHEVVIPDLPGHGETGFVSGLGYGTVEQADRLAALLDALGVDQAVVMGNSMGGEIAATLALNHPGRVRSLVLFAPAGLPSPQPSGMDQMLDAGRNPFEVRSHADFREFYPMSMARPPWLPGLALTAVAERYCRQREALVEIWRDFFGVQNLAAQLQRIAAPTLLLWGVRDRILDVSAAPRWAAALPDCREIRYPELGHMPMLEDPRRCARDVREFLERT